MPINATSYRSQVGQFHQNQDVSRIGKGQKNKNGHAAIQLFEDLVEVRQNCPQPNNDHSNSLPRISFTPAGRKMALAFTVLQLAALAGASRPVAHAGEAGDSRELTRPGNNSESLGHHHQIRHPQRHFMGKRKHVRRDVTTHVPPAASVQAWWVNKLERDLFFTPADEPAPTRVYRFDDRAPQDIFNTGFRAAGTNPDLLLHAEGIGLCAPGGHTSSNQGTHGSAFVSTTSSERTAMNMARMRVRPAGNTMEERVVWIYEIQPSSNFYSVPNSVQHTVDRITACVDTSLETRTRANRLYDVVRISRDEHEWVAHGGIEPAQIVRASQYHLNDAGMLEEIPGSRLNNENFVANPSAVANSEHGRTSPPIFWQG